MPRRNLNGDLPRRPASPAFDEEVAASLQRLGQEVRKAARQKQETPGTGIPEGLTAPNLGRVDRRAASAHHDRSV